MHAKVTLDKAGRVVIPKPLRDEWQVGPGDSLQIEAEGGRVTLRPLRTSTPLQKERGVWVYRTGQRITASVVQQTLDQVRDERHRSILGGGR